jgi:predicted RNA binding protein YcfA (HicA-like mRNA interferase family)
MRSYKVYEIINLLINDGWYLDRTKGSHRQFRHPFKKGTVTINGKRNQTLDQFILNSIFKQAEWK